MAETATATSTTPQTSQNDELKPTVYLVDDDDSYRTSLRWLLESVGLTVSEFGSGQEFLDFITPEHPGCLLLDLRMPGIHGLELQEMLREKKIRLPVIIITAWGTVPMAVRAMKNQAVDFIEKPVSEDELLSQISKALEEDRRRRERQTRLEEIGKLIQSLTNRELQIVPLVVEGQSSREIAANFDVSFKTIEAHRANIMRKTQSNSVAQLIHLWRDFIEGDEQE